MGGGGEGEEGDRGPGIGGGDGAHVRHKQDGKDAKGADEESELAAGVDAVAVVHAEAREPASGDGADAGDAVDDDERPFGVVEIKTVVLVEKLGEIEEIEPPDGIGETFGDGEGVEAAVTQEDGVERTSLSDRGEGGLGFGGSAAELVVGEDEPGNTPDESHRSGGEEGGVPTPARGDGGDEDRRDEEGRIGAGVEEAGSEGALFGREPLGGGFDGGGEV